MVSDNGVESQYTFDRLQLTDLAQNPAGQEIQRFHYAYDKNKNISQRIQNGIEDSLEYDELNRIRTSSEYNEAYSYDARGNRLMQTTEKELKIAPKELSYDAQNRLSKVVVGSETVTYQYNGDGLLVGKLEKGVQTRYYYDSHQEQIIAEATIENGTPKLIANYIRGNKLEVIKYADDTKAYPVYNGHGDVTELRDDAGGLLNSCEYDLWGNPTTKQETVHNPFLYAGELWDDTVELQYLRARWDDPSVGRFINQDTYEGELDNPLSLNLYTYVFNNLLRYHDPSGHAAAPKIDWDEARKEGLKVIQGGAKKLNNLSPVEYRTKAA
ncbi:tRNA3(Ser)-specific nuclease WapA precursor [compost metagenome]